jgi:tripartite-type tricarboxylate transporter receptor subunit TctC
MILKTFLSRTVFALLGGIACLGLHAQEYPARAVRMIVPYAAGGQGDSSFRIIANALSAQFGQGFTVENLAGSSGINAMQVAMRAPADGYTLVYNDFGHWAINPALYRKLPYDSLRDLTPVGLIASTGLFLVATGSFPANNLQELVAAVKARPDVYSYASSGIGSPHHLTMEDFKFALGLKVLHVPYKGSAQSIPALVSGEVSMAIASLPSVAGFAKEGKVKVLAVNSRNRSVFAPNLPSMGEAGIADFDHSGGIGVFAPAGTPRAVIEKLSGALTKAVALPDTVSRFAAAGLEPITNNTPERLTETVNADRARYLRVVKISGAAPE